MKEPVILHCSLQKLIVNTVVYVLYFPELSGPLQCTTDTFETPNRKEVLKSLKKGETLAYQRGKVRYEMEGQKRHLIVSYS